MTPSCTYTRPVVTDLTVCFCFPTKPPSTCELDPRIWHRLEKELYLHTCSQSAWLYIALVDEEDLAANDLVVAEVRVGEPPPSSSLGRSWESRPGGIWVLRKNFSGNIGQAVTDVDVLFGTDAVDPRPQWALMRSSLKLSDPPKVQVPVARLSVLHGRAEPIPDARTPLRFKEDGTFRILQISDTHMVTGVGICTDAIGATGRDLPESEADPLTNKFIREVLDIEKPDLVVFTGDQLHHDILDSQSALFKVVGPIIESSVPFAAVFGNHDTEGIHALSRTAQMSILRNLPFSLCESGPEQVEGTGNYTIQILAPEPSQRSLLDLYLLDSHGQILSKTRNPDYAAIKQSQIDWFTSTCQAQRSVREKDGTANRPHHSLAFCHIPVPEFADPNLHICKGDRREPPEGPSLNSHFYEALVKQGISALCCGHDHVNNFCAVLPQQAPQDGDKSTQHRPWLCYGGASGFGGYCAYGGKRFPRGTRVFELQFNTSATSLKTWRRIEYNEDRVDELMLEEHGAVVHPLEQNIREGTV